MIVIDIILYHGGLLKNANANKGLLFEGPGIKCYYAQIDCRLKTFDELKMIVMEELCVNPAVHNIQITYRMPHEVLKYWINYKYMAIEAYKHVYIDQDPNTQVSCHSTSTSVDDIVFLHYVFWSFGPCIDGFKYCKPVISIDGTHL